MIEKSSKRAERANGSRPSSYLVGGHVHEQKVPAFALWGAAALMTFTIVIAAMGRQEAQAAAANAADGERSISIHFEDQDDGGLAVMSVETGKPVTVLPPASNGFVRGVIRGLIRTRKLEGLDRNAPFELVVNDERRIALVDPTTNRRIDLQSFGDTNRAAFAALLPGSVASTSPH